MGGEDCIEVRASEHQARAAVAVDKNCGSAVLGAAADVFELATIAQLDGASAAGAGGGAARLSFGFAERWRSAPAAEAEQREQQKRYDCQHAHDDEGDDYQQQCQRPADALAALRLIVWVKQSRRRFWQPARAGILVVGVGGGLCEGRHEALAQEPAASATFQPK